MLADRLAFVFPNDLVVYSREDLLTGNPLVKLVQNVNSRIMERTLAEKWERANTDRKLVCEDDVFDLGAEVMLPDFAIEHPDGRRAVLEIIGFWTPEYLEKKLEKLRAVDATNLLVAVSENLDCSSEDIALADDRVLWFKTGIHVYDVVGLAERYAVESPARTFKR